MAKAVATIIWDKCRPSEHEGGRCLAAEACPQRVLKQEAPYEPLDSPHVQLAGRDGLPVDQHIAGAALLLPAGGLDTPITELVAQDIEQWCLGVGFYLVLAAVHMQGNFFGHGVSSGLWWV